METAPDRVVVLDSGIELTFATWVHVIEDDRSFEAVTTLSSRPDSLDDMEDSLKAAKSRLMPFAVELRANSISVTVMWGADGDPRTISCVWEDLDSKEICVRHD